MDLEGFQGSRTAMTKELRADLAKSVGDIKSTVSTRLKELDAAHTAMKREMRAELNKGRQTLTEEEAKRQSGVREFMGELGRVVAEGKASVKTLLGEFNSSHSAMSREMSAELAGGHQALIEGEKKRQSEAREFMGELGRVVAEGKAAARVLLRDFSEAQAGARDEWQTLTATLQAQRAGLAAEVKPRVEEIAEEEAAEITPDTADIRERVFEYLANHPDGTKLVGLEQEFGVARIKIARLLGNLIDENKVEKRDMLYFAI